MADDYYFGILKNKAKNLYTVPDELEIPRRFDLVISINNFVMEHTFYMLSPR